MDQSVAFRLVRPQGLLKGVEDESVCMDRLTRQPTMERAKTSITKATCTKLCQAETHVKLDAQSGFGAARRTVDSRDRADKGLPDRAECWYHKASHRATQLLGLHKPIDLRAGAASMPPR